MKNNKVPTLRFKSEKSEWSWKYLKDISKKITDKNKDNQYTETLTNSAELGIINQRDYFDKDISNKNNLNGYYIVKPDDFVYNPRISIFAPVGPIKRNKLGRTGVMSPLYYVFRTQHIDLAYLEAYFSSVKWHLYMKQNGDSGARSDRFSIKDSVFGEMPIPYPSKEIQKKIGSFFKNLDDTISLHQQELEALKQTKQGFLQKMFPKKGQLIPEIRLSGYKENWKEMKFKNLAEIRRGLTYKPKDVDKTGVRVLRSSNIKGDSFILKNDDVFVKQEAVNIDYAKENEILITSANGSSNLVGKHALIKKLDQPTVHGGFMLIASAKTPYFVNTLMSTEWYDRFIKVHVSGGNGAIGNLNKNNLENYSVMVPSIEEQIKIGDFFRQLDEVIELKEKEVEALKETKKGFLQKMFI